MGPFVGPRPYSMDAKRKIIQRLTKAAHPNKPDFGPQNLFLDNIDWIANEHLTFEKAPPLTSLPERRVKVKQLANAAEQLLKAVENLPPDSWFPILSSSRQLSRAYAKDAAAGELEKALYRYAWDSWRGDAIEPVGTASDHPRNLLGITQGIAEGARTHFDVLKARKGEAGPRSDLEGYISALAGIFKAVTGRNATANPSPSYYKAYRGHATPFVLVLAACLWPIAGRKAVNKKLGELARRVLRPRQRRAAVRKKG